MKLSSEVEKQFGHLVKTGEAQKEEGRTIIEQVKNSFDGQFEDVKGSVDQVKLASLGLLTKVRESGEKVFKELVELGEAHKSQAAAGAESKEAAV